MKALLPGAVAIVVLAWAAEARACGGSAAHDVAVTFDGQKFTVTNTGKAWVQVDFGAFGATYNLQLGPGQSDIPRSPGVFTRPMLGYESCVATPMPASPASVGTLPVRR
ncbi:MAG TPA: hypothetical protein VKR31_16600 [Rhizomicrobium sp.]|nr:hypothetical protein [Rhizomicrobium sp.]